MRGAGAPGNRAFSRQMCSDGDGLDGLTEASALRSEGNERLLKVGLFGEVLARQCRNLFLWRAVNLPFDRCPGQKGLKGCAFSFPTAREEVIRASWSAHTPGWQFARGAPLVE